MYNSLKSWINVEAKYRKFIEYDAGGNKTYDAEYTDFLCYPEGYNSVVSDIEGNSEISKQRLFMDSTVNIDTGDEITLDGEVYEAKSKAPYYRNGNKDILVVFI